MPYPPSKKRQNLLYSACYRWVRENHPVVYARMMQEAVEAVPLAQAGRKAVEVLSPLSIVKFKINPKLRTLRPMKKREEEVRA